MPASNKAGTHMPLPAKPAPPLQLLESRLSGSRIANLLLGQPRLAWWKNLPNVCNCYRLGRTGCRQKAAEWYGTAFA